MAISGSYEQFDGGLMPVGVSVGGGFVEQEFDSISNNFLCFFGKMTRKMMLNGWRRVRKNKFFLDRNTK